jgi:hypothetical protein
MAILSEAPAKALQVMASLGKRLLGQQSPSVLGHQLGKLVPLEFEIQFLLATELEILKEIFFF